MPAAVPVSRLEAHKRINYGVSLPLKDFGKKRGLKSFLRFLHFPKCGTQFAATLVHYACEHLENTFVDALIEPRRSPKPKPWKTDPTCRKRLRQPVNQNDDWWSHAPLRYPEEAHTAVVAMFRDPTTRLSSQLFHMRRLVLQSIAFGFTKEDLEMFFMLLRGQYVKLFSLRDSQQRVDANVPALYWDAVNPFWSKVESCRTLKQYSNLTFEESRCRWAAIAMHPSIKSCQLKMVLGKRCGELYVPSESDLIEAKRRLTEDFAFIGLQEQWNASVELFHRMYGGKLYPEQLEKGRVSPTPKGSSSLMILVQRSIVEAGDIMENALYKHAVSLFEISKTNFKDT